LLALAVRLPGLGTFFTADEFLWVSRSREFLGGLLSADFTCVNLLTSQPVSGLACTLRTGHPGVITMWTGSLGIVLRWLAAGGGHSLLDYVRSMPVDPVEQGIIAPVRLPTAVITSLFVVAFYGLLARLLDRRAAVLAALLLALDPFHIALSRVLHHDALATTFMTLSALTMFIYFGQQAKHRWLLLSGGLAGLGLLSKSPALYLIPFVLLIGGWRALAIWLQGQAPFVQVLRRALLDWAAWSIAFAAVFVACWPAMWVLPVNALLTIFAIGSKYASGGHAKGDFFMGTVASNPGPLFYPYTWLVRTGPWVMLGLVAALLAGLAAWRYRPAASGPDNWRQRLAWLAPAPQGGVLRWTPWILAYVFFFLVFMTIGEKKQDRYLLPVYPLLIALAGAGLGQGIDFLKSLKIMNRPQLSAYGLPLAVLVTQLLLVLPHYPYYFTYFNPLLGGLPQAAQTVTVGWGEGLDQAAAYLNQKPDAGQLRVSAWYESTFAPFFRGTTIPYSDQKGKALAGKYIVFYINQQQRQFPDTELWRYVNDHSAVDKVISVEGVPYIWIYPGPGVEHSLEDQRYEGIAALLGWEWTGSPNPDKGPLTAGAQAPFRLYWEYLGKRPEESFFVRLIGADGRTWAEGTSQPVLEENGDPAAWREGQIITEEGTLGVPPETPPGEYHLQIGFYTQAPAVTSGELAFDLQDNPTQVTLLPSSAPFPAGRLPGLALDRRLGDVRLLSVAVQPETAQPDRPLSVDVYWQADAPPATDYRARLLLLDGTGETRWAWDAAPPVSFYPTSRWKAGEVVRSQITVTPTVRTPGGRFDLALALLDGAGQLVGQAVLGQVRLEGRARSFDLPPVETSVGATFGDGIELVGFNSQSLTSNLQSPAPNLRPGDEVATTLVWRALAPLAADYTVTVQLVGPDGRVYGQHDAPPLAGAAPTSTWTPGEGLADTYRLKVAADAPAGEYRLIVGVYFPATGERLPVRDGDVVTLRHVTVTR
jgi:4-amino-4-deoxy-L-arabinose transferase-like glycosyltransferase